MPFIQHTPEEERKMLDAIGVDSIADLFAHIPDELRLGREFKVPPAATEAEVARRIQELSETNRTALDGPCFLGGGTYLHHVPAMVMGLTTRSEFVTAYTPYQPEASQGSLQAFFEYQTMICQLTGMEVSNASMYDGASAAAEAACMMRAAGGRKRNRLVLSAALDPYSERVIRTYLENLGVEIVTAPLAEDGTTDLGDLVNESTFGVMLGYPNFLGLIENLAPAAEKAHAAGAMLAVQSRPVPLGVLAAPGACGADIVFGDGAGLGCPPWYGGPGFGFFASTLKNVRRMPGRIVGETVDKEGRRTFVLTFQPREQHIRREKATSNICTNHALIALRGTIHLAALGRQGLVELADTCVDLAHLAMERITALPGYSLRWSGPFFNEFVLECPVPAREIVKLCKAKGVQPGVPLDRFFDGMDKALMVAVTDFNTAADIDALVEALGGAA